MKRFALFFACVLMAGCASNLKEAAKDEPPPRAYEPVAASALAFDSPIFIGYQLPGLDRAAREPGVFMGFQETTVETFIMGVEDHQSSDPCLSYYDRWSYTEKSGTRYR